MPKYDARAEGKWLSNFIIHNCERHAKGCTGCSKEPLRASSKRSIHAGHHMVLSSKCCIDRALGIMHQRTCCYTLLMLHSTTSTEPLNEHQTALVAIDLHRPVRNGDTRKVCAQMYPYSSLFTPQNSLFSLRESACIFVYDHSVVTRTKIVPQH
eukprot:6190157-Pleurochrysis_carterae.AAC.1